MERKIICGNSFEELSEDEMMELEGGWTTVFTCTTLPCGIGASISTVAVSVYYNIRKWYGVLKLWIKK